MSVAIAYTLGSRGVAKLSTLDTKRDTATALRPTIDESLTVKNETESVIFFDGTILSVRDRPGTDPNTGVVTEIDATDYWRVCDARIVNKTYAAGQTRKQIVSDLRTTYLHAFGITLDGGMNDGAVMPEMTFGNVTVTAALTRTIEVSGQITGTPEVCRITPAKVLQAFPVGSSVAPYSLTSTNGKILNGPKWTKSRGKFVSQVYLTYGSERQLEKTQTFASSSVGQTVWTLDYPGVGPVLRSIITVNGGLAPLAPLGSGFTWEWNASTNSIVRNPSSPGGEVVSVTYDAQFPATVRRPETPPAQPWDAVLTAPDVFDKTAATAIADALLARYSAAVARTVTIQTREGLLGTYIPLPGDTITITVPERTLSGSWLITAVTIRTEVDAKFSYDLTCVEGTVPQDSWQDSLRNLFGTSSSSAIITGSVATSTTGVSGGGTAGVLPKWATGTALGDSLIREGTGTPEGVVTAPIASLFLRTDTGDVYRKATGSGNTGWTLFGGAGSGTVNTLSKWVTTTTLGDSLLSEGSGIVSVNAHLHPALTDTYDLGRYDKLWNQGYLAQLNAILFALETQTLMGGYSTIGYNAGSFAAAVSSADTQIDFGTGMISTHFVLVRAHDTAGAITSEYMQITGLVSGTIYTVTRNISGLGAKNWAKGTPFLVLGYGDTLGGTGRIDLLAYDGKPRIQFVEQREAYNLQITRAVLGNLNGYYGYATDLFGFAAGDSAAANVTIDATNGLRIRHGSTNKITLSAAGNASFTGSITAASGTIGGWSIGASALTAGNASIDALGDIVLGTGIGDWVRLSSSNLTYRIWAGHTDPASANFKVSKTGDLTASNVTLSGNITASSGDVSGALAAGSITSTMIAASAITTAKLDAGAVTAAKIAANTITSSQIAAGSITADRLSVSTLSAISADLGTVTAGTIASGSIAVGSGGTLTAGGVTLSSTGVSLTAGDSSPNYVKWSNGVAIKGYNHGTFGDILGYLATAHVFIGDVLVNSLATTTSNLVPMVGDSDGRLLRKTNGHSGTFDPAAVSSIVVQSGIITSVT